MEANLAAEAEERQAPRGFPYANWGAAAAVGGMLLAIGTGLVLGAILAIPAFIAEEPNDGEVSSAANALAQLGAAIAFVMVPMLIAARRGAPSVREILRRLGLRRFRPSAGLWMLAAVFAYLTFAALYVAIVGEPEQEDIAEGFGAIPVQILLIVFAAAISEEICFRGFLFGGLRERFPRIAAALLSAVIFGSLHALTGISAVPPLIAFGFVMALLYEKTGSIVPGILLHMLNNSVALLAQ
ncbi:MAG TPA: CPBP family intramembrane glutamic endopeptidase [Solirubrobacterales bacterium]